MRVDMDKIQFDSRWEILDVRNALAVYIQEHPRSEDRKTVERLADLLEIMDISW